MKYASMAHPRKRPDPPKDMLKVVSNDLNSGEEENQRDEPYRERQKLLRSLVITKGLHEENEQSMLLALQTRSFFTRIMSSLSDRLKDRMCPRCLAEELR